MTTSHFTEPTTGYWQRILAPHEVQQAEAPWRYRYPARLPDGRTLMLPIRQLASDPSQAVASLIANQASLEVIEALGLLLAQRLMTLQAEAVVGIPTLGLTLAPIVARHLGHARIVPLGYSRKFWYRDELSAAVWSITTPTAGKRVYLDPNLLPLIEGRRVVLVDDAISTAGTVVASWNLIESAGATVLGCGVAMRQGHRWEQALGPDHARTVIGVFDSPLLQAVPEGWVERA